MGFKFYSIFFVLIFSAWISEESLADKVCVKAKSKGSTVKLTSVVMPADAACPKGTTSILDTATLTGLIGPQGPKGDTGAQGAQGPAGVAGNPGQDAYLQPSEVGVACNVNSQSTNTTYKKMGDSDIGSFTKSLADTDVKVSFYGILSANFFTGSGPAIFQIRVNNEPAATGTGTSVIYTGNGNLVNHTLSATFQGLPVGQNTVSIWVKTTNASVIGQIDPLCVNQSQLSVMEFRSAP